MLGDDVRGVSYVEYIILLATIGLAAMLGYRSVAGAMRDRSERQAACVASLDPSCSSNTGASSLPPGASSGTSSGTTAPPGLARQAVNAVVDAGRGFLSQGWNDVKGLGTLAFATSPPGAAYYALAGKPNPAAQAVVGLAKLGLSATPPGRIVAELGGPDPLGDTVRSIGQEIKASWQRNKAETIGRAAFEVAAIVVPLAKAKTAAEIAEVAQKTEQIAKAGDLADVAAESRALEDAAVAAKTEEVGAVVKATSKLGEGNFSKVYEISDGGKPAAVIVPNEQSAGSLKEVLEHQTPPEYGGPPPPANGVREVLVDVDGTMKKGVVMAKLDGTTLAPMFPRESPNQMLERLTQGLPEPDMTPNPGALAGKVQQSHIDSFQRAVDKATADGVVLDDLDGHNVMLGPNGQTVIFDTKPVKVSEVPAADRELYQDLLQEQPGRAQRIIDAMKQAKDYRPPQPPH